MSTQYHNEITRFQPSSSIERHSVRTAALASALVTEMEDDEYVIVAEQSENGVSHGQFFLWCHMSLACVRLNTDHTLDGTDPRRAAVQGVDLCFRDTPNSASRGI